MKRRQVILGAGATVTGGSALIGSGAFSAVSAERDLAVTVADDADSYLRLAPCEEDDSNRDYLTNYDGDGLFGIDLAGDNDRVDGQGVNLEARTRFHNLFEVCNQGTNDACVDFAFAGDVPLIEGPVPDRFEDLDGIEDVGEEDADPAIVFYKGDDPSDVIDLSGPDPDSPNAIELDTGECQCIGLEVRVFGVDEPGTLLDTDLEIVADANAECGEIERPDCANLTGGLDCVDFSNTGDTPSIDRHFIDINNIGDAPVDNFGAVVLDSPDQTDDDFRELAPDDPPVTPSFDTAIPVLGIVYWIPEEGCEPEGVPRRDQWENPGLMADISDDGLADLEIGSERYDDLVAIENFEDLEAEFDDDAGTELFEEIPEHAFIAAIDYSEYEVTYESEGESFDSPQAEIVEKVGCEQP